MLLSKAINQRIRAYLKQKNMSLWQLYKASGVPKSTIFSYMSSETALPRMDTLLFLCEGLGVTLREFFDDPIFEDIEQD